MRAKLAFAESNILDVKVACINREQLLLMVDEWAGQADKKTILYTNAHCLNVASQDVKYRELLNQADLVYADGVSVVWSSRLLGGCSIEKITGADWIDDYCSLAQGRELRTFILAGKSGIAQKAAKNLMVHYPKLHIVGVCDGFFEEGGADEAALIAEINRAHPHVVFVGMGVPRQEKWLAAQRTRIEAPVCWAIGALFDYVAGIEPRVPRWLDSIGMEWFWRLLVDPKGKWRRYIIGNPLFVYRVLHQKVAGR
jgi:N-acetylglucosaminyldiphosphoundecaprenol N-acetyl-beta-D-mannosaminyltransferase